jgi:hypothetical protein
MKIRRLMPVPTAAAAAVRAALHDSELRSLDAAIAEAGKRVEAQRASEQQAQAREVTRELLKRAALLLEHGRTLDDANAVRNTISRCLRAIRDQRFRPNPNSV